MIPETLIGSRSDSRSVIPAYAFSERQRDAGDRGLVIAIVRQAMLHFTWTKI
jgi:hypothetical protein